MSGIRAAANEAFEVDPPVSTPPPADVSPEPEPEPVTATATDAVAVSASEPPASVEDLEEEARFFHEGRIQTPHAFTVADDLELENEPPKPSPKMTPIARARRAHFSKYVKGAMVAATAILTLAGIRLVMGRADRNPDSFATSARLASPPVAVAVAAPTPPANPPEHAAEKAAEPTAVTAAARATEMPKPEPALAAEPAKPEVVEVAKADAPKPEVAKAPEAAKTEPAKIEASKADPPAAGGKTAAQEKAEARRMLERGKSAAAIEAGERAVALDPTDGEAWLILGAAYQDKGNLKDARRAFQSCTKEGKRGPIAECRAMLRQ